GGFAPISRVLNDESAGGTYTFFKPETFTVPSASQDIFLTDSKGTEVSIPANSLTRLDGQAIVNPVTFFITTVDPCNPLLESPVSNVAHDSLGTDSFLSSLSTAHVQIRDAAGGRLTLLQGTAARLALPLSSACALSYPKPP